jgi:outer membrane protein assembly factor BamB
LAPNAKPPVKWSKEQNIRWRIPLPGPGQGTPMVWGDRIFVPSADGENLFLFAFNLKDGKEVWRWQAGSGNQEARSGEGNYAAPSPVTDGERVYAFFGNGILAALDYDGKLLWQDNIQKRYGNFNLYFVKSNTPLLLDGKLILPLLDSDNQRVIAFDSASGKELWQLTRPSDAKAESMHSYASPVPFPHGEETAFLIHGSDAITAHHPKDGKELWRLAAFQKPTYNNFFRFVTSPIYADGKIIAPSAKNGPVFAIDPQKAEGTMTPESKAVIWGSSNGTPDVPSPLLIDGLLYLCRENGMLQVWDAKTGEELYKERVHARTHRGSPIYADGKIYLTGTDGTVSVIKHGRTYNLLAQNNLEEYTAASPVPVGDTLYIRTYEALYAIGE